MSYKPKEGSDIEAVFHALTPNQTTLAELTEKAARLKPTINKKSVTVHLAYLTKKNIVSKLVNNHGIFYSLGRPVKVNGKKVSKAQEVLNYCKSRIGKRVDSIMISDNCYDGVRSSSPGNLIRSLSIAGALEPIEGTTPKAYLVLKEIKNFTKIPVSNLTKTSITKTQKQDLVVKNHVDQSNISKMSIGEILTDYINLKEENARLKDALQHIANAVFQIGEIER